MCGGDGHTEAVKVDFDPHELPYEGLLQVSAHSLDDHAVCVAHCIAVLIGGSKHLTVLCQHQMRHGSAGLTSFVLSK